jgi:hypothetical protein
MHSRQQWMGTIAACDDFGEPVQIDVVQEFAKAHNGVEKPGSRVMATKAGLRVERVSRGVYRVAPTGQRLTSTDPFAP